MSAHILLAVITSMVVSVRIGRCAEQASPDPFYTNPSLVCSISEGSAEDELGWGEGLQSCPADFGIDLSGNVWILDAANQRLKKFGATGEFLRV